MVPLTENAVHILEARYLRRDASGEIVETPDELFQRVATAVAQAERQYGSQSAVDRTTADFHDLLTQLDFLPNSPTLMNAGLPRGQLSACFVLPVPDDMGGIFDSLKLAALIQQTGGGTGFSFSRLRPAGDIVTSTGGRASGPVSFMKIFDAATEHIRRGGKRRGANMGVLHVTHPDIESFIDAKQDGFSLRNFNLSVGSNDAFMIAAANDAPFNLTHPHSGDVVKTVAASELLTRITDAAWQTGDPGMLFLDTINRANPTPALGSIEATNPCGEVPLLPYEACNLGSINLSHCTIKHADGSYSIDYDRLARVTRLAVRFLDNVIDVSTFPDPRIDKIVRGNRKIGLGVMGFAELLVRLDIPYGSDDAVRIAEQVMKRIAEQAHAASEELAATRGPFPNWEQSVYHASSQPLRNATLTSIAPTGTIGMIAGTSPSIEPLFALAYRRTGVLSGETLLEVSPLFQHYVETHGESGQRLLDHVRTHGTLDGCPNVDAHTRKLFETALEIAPQQHLAIQAAFQRHVDNAVSKTINLTQDTSAADIAKIYHRAWELGLKGITVYRFGSRADQVIQLGEGESAYEREHLAHCDPHECHV